MSRAQTLRQEAETAVNEMEEAANAQLHNLANQSQVTLSAIEGRLIKSKQRIDEFKMVIIVSACLQPDKKTYFNRLERSVTDNALVYK